MVYESFSTSEGGADESRMERMADFLGPGHVDQLVRQAIQCCWMALPKQRRNADELEKQVRRIVDRALRDFREDSEAFGRSQ
jgi:hypothetical protein